MALQKNIIVGKIEILPDGQMQIREDTVIAEDGIELARTYRRYVLAPGEPLPAIADPRVQTVAETLWTPDVVKDYQAAVAARAEAIRGGPIVVTVDGGGVPLPPR